MSTKQYIDVNRTLRNLDDELDRQTNIQAIHDFINHCAAEGISEVQQVRHIQSLKTLITRFGPEGFELRGASERDLKAILAKLNRSDYADATKQKFKAAVKKFYRVENGGEHPHHGRPLRLRRIRRTRRTHKEKDEPLIAVNCTYIVTSQEGLTYRLFAGTRRGHLAA